MEEDGRRRRDGRVRMVVASEVLGKRRARIIVSVKLLQRIFFRRGVWRLLSLGVNGSGRRRRIIFPLESFEEVFDVSHFVNDRSTLFGWSQ